MKKILGLLKYTREKVTGLSAMRAKFDILDDLIRNKIGSISTRYLQSNSAREVTCDQNIENDSNVFSRADSIILKAIDLGKKGKLKISPETISISATENCNLQCIMCPGHAGKSGPKISLDEFDKLIRPLAGKDVNFGSPKLLDMTSGEPTLNQNLGPIYRLFKDIFPRAKISMISNGTLSIRGRIREVFELTDRVGLSMDGATKETYERIRKGSVYKNVVRNVKDVAELKKQGANCETLQILFVAMDQNIHELPEMVRLASSLGVPGVFVQAAEVRTRAPFNFEGQNIKLSLSKSELAPYLVSAKSEAKCLGVDLLLTSELEDALQQGALIRASDDSVPKNPLCFDQGIKTCSYPWFFAPRISQNNEKGIYPTTVCCHMPHQGRRGNLGKRPELNNKPILEMFNSEFYWDIRLGLLDGSLATDACQGCQYFRSTQWTANQLRELEGTVNSIKRSIY